MVKDAVFSSAGESPGTGQCNARSLIDLVWDLSSLPLLSGSSCNA